MVLRFMLASLMIVLVNLAIVDGVCIGDTFKANGRAVERLKKDGTTEPMTTDLPLGGYLVISFIVDSIYCCSHCHRESDHRFVLYFRSLPLARSMPP